ncbi:MAG: hypothetical protein HMLKMBBP_00580 [Planctomycetes bacterium]|nr:hypothetical protein [Planctomycetota bacterium]
MFRSAAALALVLGACAAPRAVTAEFRTAALAPGGPGIVFPDPHSAQPGAPIRIVSDGVPASGVVTYVERRATHTGFAAPLTNGGHFEVLRIGDVVLGRFEDPARGAIEFRFDPAADPQVRKSDWFRPADGKCRQPAVHVRVPAHTPSQSVARSVERTGPCRSPSVDSTIRIGFLFTPEAKTFVEGNSPGSVPAGCEEVSTSGSFRSQWMIRATFGANQCLSASHTGALVEGVDCGDIPSGSADWDDTVEGVFDALASGNPAQVGESVSSARAAHHCDLMCVVASNVGPDKGLAPVPVDAGGVPLKGLAAIHARDEVPWFVVRADGLQCGNYLTFPHELGHALGCAHGPDEDGEGSGSSADAAAYCFSYAHRYRLDLNGDGYHDALSERFMTVESDVDGSNTIQRSYSDPGSFHPGTSERLGVDSSCACDSTGKTVEGEGHNNAETIRRSAPIVAAFRPHSVGGGGGLLDGVTTIRPDVVVAPVTAPPQDDGFDVCDFKDAGPLSFVLCPILVIFQSWKDLMDELGRPHPGGIPPAGPESWLEERAEDVRDR